MSTTITASLIDRLESALMDYPPADVETIHHFSPGVYAREMRVEGPRVVDGLMQIPVIAGRRHKTRHLNIVSRGHLEVMNELDGSRKHFFAGDHFISEPGTRRAAIIHEPSTWTTVHANPDDEDEVSELEFRLAEPHDNPLLSFSRSMEDAP